MNTLEKVRKAPHAKTMGIELECIVTFSDFEKVMNQFVGFFYAGNDGSIRPDYSGGGSRGIEFVSQPLPYSALLREIDRLNKRVIWRHNESCGIHVHVSRHWLNDVRAIRLQKSICALTNSEFASLFGRRPNDYCLRTARHTRYCAVNTTNSHTIEFRMFASGDAAWAKECLRRVKLLVEYRGKGLLSYTKMLDLFTAPE